MIPVKNQKEIKIMREGGKILAEIFETLKNNVKPDVRTEELDTLAHNLILKNNAQPSFLGYNNYPKSICTSINSEVVHGIPNSRKLKEGDILSLDIGVLYNGFHVDAAMTLPIGHISEEDKRLIESARKSLFVGLGAIKSRARIGDISEAIQKSIESDKFSVVRDCTGHGVGKSLHEEPSIPNFGDKNTGPFLSEGNTIALEPMVNVGTFEVRTLDDSWTIRTSDGKKSAHFELTVLVLKNSYENLTPIEI